MQVLCHHNLPNGRIGNTELLMKNLIIVGGGLAGCEAAWQAAERGIPVRLFEMRPLQTTSVHKTDQLAEIVCSNSLGSLLFDRPSGLLINELQRCNSLLVSVALAAAIPAGSALAVDREIFGKLVTEKIAFHPLITVQREEITEIPDGYTIIATGPLTSQRLSASLAHFLGKDHLSFFDAVSPIIAVNSINLQIAFRASRFNRSTLPEGDYINCPMDEKQYHRFVEELSNARTIDLADNEKEIQTGVKAGHASFFEGCLPIEIMAKREKDALSYGPLRPIGIIDPVSGKRPHAVVQLRQDDLAGSLFNLVGFQTNLLYNEQKRIIHMIPGLEQAEFVRYGQMHRNTFIDSPTLLEPSLVTRCRKDLFIAGQLTGIEGYLGNIASGLVAGINAARLMRSKAVLKFPLTTMIGALMHYICRCDPKVFQPMKANFGLLPPLDTEIKSKCERNHRFSERSLADMDVFIKISKMLPT